MSTRDTNLELVLRCFISVLAVLDMSVRTKLKTVLPRDTLVDITLTNSFPRVQFFPRLHNKRDTIGKITKPRSLSYYMVGMVDTLVLCVQE